MSFTRMLCLAAFALPVLALPACGDDDPAPAATGSAGSSAGGSNAGGSSAAGAAGSSAEACKGITKSATGNCSEEMFCKYGLDAFKAVNESIVKRATASGIEAEIGDTFVKLVANPDPQKVPTFKNNLAIFLVNAYGGDPVAYKYTGGDMKTAHKGLAITSEQYDAFVNMVIVPALADNGVPEADITKCFAPPVVDTAFKAAIVGQ